MTHDDLLEIIDTIQNTINANKVYARKGFDALHAVVELHKPTNFGMIQNGEPWCSVCHIGVTDYDCSHQDYPCPTIQAIEKEL